MAILEDSFWNKAHGHPLLRQGPTPPHLSGHPIGAPVRPHTAPIKPQRTKMPGFLTRIF